MRTHTKNPFAFSSLALAPSATATLTGPAYAQSEQLALEEVIVTAQKRE